MKEGRSNVYFNCNLLKSSLLIMVFLMINSTECVAFDGIDLTDEKAISVPPEMYIKGNVLYFNGQIINTSHSEFLKLVKNSHISVVSISSTGGDVRNALDIAKYIYKNKINIEVRSICASACANYLFPAANKKYLSNDSYLLWHGGIHSPDKELPIHGNISRKDFFNLKNIKELKRDDIDFNKMIGVNFKISFCPQLQDDYRDKFPEKWFSYSPEDLERFGIKNIHYANTASQWAITMRKKHVIFASYCN